MLKSIRVLTALLIAIPLAGCGGGDDGGGAVGEVGVVGEMDGLFIFGGVRFRWEVKEGTVVVRIYSPSNQEWRLPLPAGGGGGHFDFSFSNGKACGVLLVSPKTTATGGYQEAKNITVTKGGQTRTFVGVMGAW